MRLKLLSIILAAVVLPAGTTVAGGDPWLEQAKLIAADGAASDQLGLSVALEGDTAVVGARAAAVDGNSEQGAAYVFVYDGEAWVEQDKLTASDGGAADWFGQSVAISGDTILVGATQDFSGGPGAAYIFVHDGNGWVEQAKLTASDGASGDKFGTVDLFGDTALVGARRAKVDGDDNGVAYVFTRDGSGVWSEEDKLTPDDWPISCSSINCPRFGHSVALWEDTALVGAVRMQVDGNNRAGAVYVFVRETGDWTQQAVLTRPVAGFNEQFGTSVALQGDAALVGAPNVEVDGNFSQGVVHAFTRNGSTWTEQQELTASDGASGDRFGTSVALSDGVALTGAPFTIIDGNNAQGAAYRFTLDGGSWSEQQKFTASDGAAFDSFGTSAALSGSTALVGAPQAAIDGNSDQGAAYVFAGEIAGEPDFLFAPDNLDFGEVEVDTTSAPQTATLSNTGGADATGLMFNTPGGGFDVDTGDCGDTLPAGGDCEVSVTFTPAATGPAGATLTAGSDQGASADLALTGEGIEPAQLSYSPSSLDFGDVDVGTTSAPFDTTLSNSGDTDATGLNFSTPGSGFAVVTNECGTALPAGQDCLLSLTFTPASAGPASDTLTAEDDAGASASLNLAGNGEDSSPEPGILSVEPAELDFGTVDVGSDEVLSVTVSNAAGPGAEALTLDTLGLAGDGGMTGPSTTMVSLRPDGSQFGGHSWSRPVITPDGRYVAFTAQNGDGTIVLAYRHDRLIGTTELVSVNDEGQNISTEQHSIAISPDGRHVMFRASFATSRPRGIYIRDMEAPGVNEPLDMPTTDGEEPNINPPIENASISADFRIVAFTSQATNLVPGVCATDEPGGGWCVYVFDRDANTVERVSVAYDGTPADLPADNPVISADGRYVAFWSWATNHVPDDTNDEPDVFVYDRETGVTERVSVASNGSEGDDLSGVFGIDITPGGRYVAFFSHARNLMPDTTGVPCSPTHNCGDIFIRDRAAGTTERLLPVAADGTAANRSKKWPVITPDGRYVAFVSDSTGLVPGDFNGWSDHFIHDRFTGDNELVSVATDGTQGNDHSYWQRFALTPDGRFVAFISNATNLDLTEPDANSKLDVFVRDRGGVAGDVFAITGGDCAVGTVLEAGESCMVEITFSPPEVSVFEDALNVETDDEQSAEVPLQGTGIAVPEPVLAFSPASLDFGEVAVGTTSAPRTATLANTGDSDATGLAFTESGGGSDFFDADTADCGDTLPAGESCQVVITFTPPGTGLTFAALNAESDEGAATTLNLMGSGGEPPPDQIFEDRFQVNNE